VRIAIVGLGYVGIQLAVALGRKHQVVGLDLDEQKVTDYQANYDATGEVSEAQLRAATHLEFTTQPSDLKGCDIFIIAVPTPVDPEKNPDFGPLVSASRTVGSAMAAGATVVYESTVYPGATEEVCVPELEQNSGLTWKKDFSVGYSPERINPGDPEHTLATITKVVSADNDETLDLLADLYGEVVTAGIHRAPSIKVAEAAKVIENTQRDLNIALVNELAVLFDRLDINTRDVLDAAGSKWNFLPFKPGLVGGHCIGVDPYYLTHKAEMIGYQPEVILAGRRINDSMAEFVAGKALQLIAEQGINASGATANVLGVTFKENCPDTRNSQVFALIGAMEKSGITVSAVDPRADVSMVQDETGIRLKSVEELEPADMTLLAVPHQELCERGYAWIKSITRQPGVFIDLQAVFRAPASEDKTLSYWSL
jgi:UDP-N-acetyl-D-galactosamine dehydrogenase